MDSRLVDIVFQYMKKHRSGLTVKECEHLFGTTELRKIVSDLKANGKKIGDIWETGVNRFGIKTRWKRYFAE